MKKLFQFFFLLLTSYFSLLTSIHAYSYLGTTAIGDMVIGRGARSGAMGGAGLGGSDEPSTLISNPATMSFLKQRQISVGFGFAPFTERVVTSDERIYYNESSYFQINNIAAVLPFRGGGFAVGFAYAPLFDYNYKHRQNLFVPIAPATKMGYKKFNASGRINTFSPAVSVKLGDLISLGLSYNIINGSLKRKTQEADTTATPTEIKYSTSTKSTVLGSNVNFGVVFGGIKHLKMGLSYYGASSVKLKGTTTNNKTGVEVSTDKKIDLPGYIGFGAVWNFGGRYDTKLAFDILPIPYSGVNVDGVKIGWDDITVLKMGVEHFVQENIPLRFGYYSLPFYVDRKIELVAFTVGLGYKLSENIFFDIIGEYGKRNFFGDNLFLDNRTSVDESFKRLMFGAKYKW